MIKFEDIGRNEKIRFGLFIAASVILAVILIANYRKSRKPVQFKEAAVIVEKTESLKKKKIKKEKPMEIHILLQEVGREDPFLPVSEKYMSEGRTGVPLKLTGIVRSGEKQLAIINDALVGEGDKIGGKTVIKIGKEKVVMREDGREYELRLPGFKYPKKSGK